MFNGKFLNSKERKEIFRLVEEQFGCSFTSDLVFCLNNKEKVFVVNRDIDGLPLDNLRVDKLGMYVGTIQADGFRLSIEGSELIGPQATKNILDLSFEQMREWLKGKDIEGPEGNSFILLRHNSYWLGCGKLKEGRILNYIPKNRRILADD